MTDKPQFLVNIKTSPAPESSNELYLDLLKKTLTRAIVGKRYERHSLNPETHIFALINKLIKIILKPLGLELVKVIPSSEMDYEESTHLASTRNEDAESMLGIKQFDQMQSAIVDVVGRNVPGDVLEAGVWRGGMTVFMQGVLRTIKDETRKVWVVDSFEGLPDPDSKHDTFGWEKGNMSVSLANVKSNFHRYGLLDDNVKFLKGLFDDTLPQAPIDQLSILRVDGDLYESTLSVLTSLYPKLSVGGYAIFDDYINLQDCRRAIDEYRDAHSITDEIISIDERAVYWIKT